MSSKLCNSIRHDFPDHVQNKLAPSESRMIEQHVQNCARCFEILEGMRSTLAMLDTGNTGTIDRPDWNRFLVEINDAIDRPGKGAFFSEFLHHPRYVPAGAIALLILLFLVFRPWSSDTKHLILSGEIQDVIAALDTNESALLGRQYAETTTVPGAIFPSATQSISSALARQADENLIFDDISYSDIVSASLEYLDDNVIMDLLPVDQSRELLNDTPGNGNL